MIAPRYAARNVAGCGLAGVLATALGIGHPYWAMVSAVVPLAHQDLRGQVVRGAQRVVGTAAGPALAAVLLAADLPGLALIAVIVVLQAGAEPWVGRNYAIALVAVTPLALLMVDLVSPSPIGTLLFDRGVETVIGVIVGVAVGVAHPYAPPPPPRSDLTQNRLRARSTVDRPGSGGGFDVPRRMTSLVGSHQLVGKGRHGRAGPLCALGLQSVRVSRPWLARATVRRPRPRPEGQSGCGNASRRGAIRGTAETPSERLEQLTGPGCP